MRRFYVAALGGLLVAASPADASVITIPDSALTPSTNYYTDIIGGGLGTVMVTTGGGNAANVGDPSGRNDDGFRGPIPLGFSLTFFGNTNRRNGLRPEIFDSTNSFPEQKRR